jgi:TatD DNase family protein
MIEAVRSADAPLTDATKLALVDTHCHLDADAFESEPVAGILARAHKAGVTRVVTIGTRLQTSREAARIARIHSDVWATVGVDPNDLDDWTMAHVDELADLAGGRDVVAIGEIGLDYYWERSPRETQRRAFEAQLDLAQRLDLPVVIHSRDAHDDVAAILLAWAADHPRVDRPLGVMHCYAETVERAWPLVEAGFLISLSGIVTFRNNKTAPRVATELPLSALVLETDAPYLAPHPHRGRRNEPAYVRLIAERVADLREAPLFEVADATSANAARLFGWDNP